MTQLRTIDSLHDYQLEAVTFQASHPYTALWISMGLGKTVITLTNIAYLVGCGHLIAILIVAPIRVCRLVWRQEAMRWAHTQHLTFSMLVGTKDQRTRALLRPANVYLINHENLGWLAETLDTYFLSKKRALPFDGLVWDEISKMKNSSTQRVKSVKKILPHFKWRTGLTGTPASNGYKDLHGQFLMLDEGARLGTSKTTFTQRFYQTKGEYKKIAYKETEDQIKQLIGDITLEMSGADYLKMPDLIVNNVDVELPDDVRAQYDRLEKEYFVTLDSGADLEVFNAASLTNKLLQFSNGAVYPVAGMPLWEAVHDAKLDALEEIIDEANGQQVLCSYSYRSDAERIMKRFHELRPINLTECKSEKALNNAMARWKAGDCRLMIGHPACLHPRTKVLTERHGWVRIVDVAPTDRVFDGVEFVSHSGCSYSGFKEVIDVFGVTMTLNHKLLVDGEWMEARDVRDTGSDKAKALFQWETVPCGVGQVPAVQWSFGDGSPERHQKQQGGARVLSGVYSGDVPPHDQYSNLGNLARYETESTQPREQKLWWARDRRLPRVAQIRDFLRRHVGRLFGRLDDRACGREPAVFQEELQVGDQYGTTGQQTQQQVRHIQRRTGPFGRVSTSVRVQQNEADNATQPWHDGGRGGEGLRGVGIREESAPGGHSTPRKAHVYDLVDCGPRHQFLICNDDGEMFISHNSMGHGVDGLQEAGHTLVWYGLNWSLDLYEQFNARIRRQGQGHPVICHRILCKNTLDQAQSAALDDKASTQTALRAAIKEYRQSKKL